MDVEAALGSFSAEKELMVKLVEPTELNEYWDTAKDLIALDESWWERFHPSDIYVEIFAKRFQLWLFGDEEEIYACMITEIRVYPQSRVVHILSASALPDRDALEMLVFADVIEHWAKSQGAEELTIPCGRKGWQRILPDYEFRGVVLRKKLGSIKEH